MRAWALRKLEAEETAQDALRFAREIRRREALQDGELNEEDPLHRDQPQPEDIWEDVEHLADGPDVPHPEGPDLQADPVILLLHEQANQIKRQKKQANWEAQYTMIFEAFLEVKHETSDWSTPDWSRDLQRDCNCGTGPGTSALRH